MPYHSWYDEDDNFDFNRLNEAGRFIYSYCKRRAWLTVHWKEKYGTLRYDIVCYFGWWPIHSIFKRGHLYYRWPKWVMHIDIALGRFLRLILIAQLIRRYQRFIFRRALFAAVKKYPDMRDEILEDAPEEVVGTEIHNKYWTRH